MCVATVAGGSAERGLLIGHLAKKLCDSDGVTELETLIRQAIQNMGLKEWNQVPDVRKTLTKRLILPPTCHNRMQDMIVKKVRIYLSQVYSSYIKYITLLCFHRIPITNLD